MQPSSSATPRDAGARSRIRLAAIALVFAALTYRLFHLTGLYSVNIFFWDQWDFNNATLFQHHSLWEIFRWQHGPHRQGLGGLLSAWIDPLTSWNSRTESFIAAGLLVTAALLALWLKYRLFGRLVWTDVLIPALMLSPTQWESVWTTANLTLAMFPLLIMAYCLLWVWNNRRLKYGLIVLLNFGAIYTGFAFFLGLLTPALLLGAWRQERSRGRQIYLLICLALSVISVGSFFAGWRNESASGCPSDLVPAGTYLQFASVLFASAFGIPYIPPYIGLLAIAAGGVVLIFLTAIAVAGWRRVLGGAETTASSLVLSILSLYILIFAAASAAGRACIGPEAAQSSRYGLYLNMSVICLYFAALNRRPWRRIEPAFLVAVLALPALVLLPFEEGTMIDFYNTKAAWRACYLSGKNFDECTGEAGDIYPSGAAKSDQLPEKLDLLKRTHRNLFADR